MTEIECRRSLQFITEIKVKALIDLHDGESIIRERDRQVDKGINKEQIEYSREQLKR